MADFTPDAGLSIFEVAGLPSSVYGGLVMIPIVIKCCALHSGQQAIPKLRLRLPLVYGKCGKRNNLMQSILPLIEKISQSATDHAM